MGITRNKIMIEKTLEHLKNDEIIKIEDDSLYIHFGESKLCLMKNGEITLENNHSHISLSANGTVTINGAHIEQRSLTDFILQGQQSIHLNSP